MTAPRRLRSTLRPLKLRSRHAREMLAERVVRTREASYQLVSNRLTPDSPWSVTKGSVAASWFRGAPNFGDAMAPLILESMLGMRPLWVTPDFQPKIVSTGSVLRYVRQGDMVIGSGMIRPEAIVVPQSAVVLAVRGPRTAECVGLEVSDTTFGDPGMLIAEILGIERVEALDGPIGIIPHYVDQPALQETQRLHPPADDVVMIDVRSDVRTVVEAISRTRCCISSSLHGLIVAESLGIPALWMTITDGVTGGSFKFGDYYEGTGRPEPAALTYFDAIEASAQSLPRYFTDYAGIARAFAQAQQIISAVP